MSNNPLHGTFVQGIFTNRRNKLAVEPGRQQASAPSIEPVKRYISLRIYQTEQLQNDPNPSHVYYLKAGQYYSIVLQCTANRMDDDQQEITINGPFKLYLECLVDQGICPFTIPQNQLDFVGPFASAIKIPFNLPHEDCPSCNVTFKAKFVANETIDGPIPASRTLVIKGNSTPENVEWLSTRYIGMGVPKNTIVLSAETSNISAGQVSKECQIAMCNYYSKEGMFSTILNTGQLISIADSMKSQGDPEEILRRLREFSFFPAGKIMRWIRMVRAEVEKRGQQLALVIFDTTHFEIPWELLEVDHDQYIGAVAQVARWLHLEVLGEARYLAITDYICDGSVLSYLDRGLEGSGEERALLQTFMHSEMSSLEELQERLEEPLQDMGLLYIGSHGGDGTHLYTSMLSEEPQPPAGSLPASWLVGMRRQLDPRPILFINACESARMIYKRDSRAHTLVKNFLLFCASNYIGTIARVDSQEAPRIAKRLLELAWKDEGVQIVELLRRLRDEAVKHMLSAGRNSAGQQELVYRKQQKRDAAAQLLNTFAYVYYGNPLARLRLRRAQDTQEGA